MAATDPKPPLEVLAESQEMIVNRVPRGSLPILIIVSAGVSLLGVAVGILYLAGMQTPTQGMTYGFVLEMLSDPVFIKHHISAFAWLFGSGFLSGLVTLMIVNRRAGRP